jgi:O-antigen/teichoic acid export membrane protein
MEERFVKSVPWSLASFGAPRLLGFATTVVLVRLLTPDDFGLIALATVVIGAFGVAQDLGLGSSIVLRQDFDQRALATVFGLMILSAALITLLVAASSPVAATLLSEDELKTILPPLSVILVLSCAGNFYGFLMQRELEFRRRFAALAAQTLGYAAIAIVLAAAGAGVWSLVIGQIAGAVAYSVVGTLVSPNRVRPSIDRRIARDAFSTGRGFMVQGWLGWLRQNVDYIAVQRMFGVTSLGYYSVAYKLGDLVPTGIANPVAKVTFAGFARMRHRGEDVRPAFLLTLKLVALVAFPIGIILSAAADPFTRALFGERWVPMIGALSIFGIWAAVRALKLTEIWMLNAIGEAGYVAKVAALLLPPLVPVLILGAELGGITGVAWVLLGDAVVSTGLYIRHSARQTEVGLRDRWRALRASLLAAPGAWAAAFGVAQATEGWGPGASLAASTLAGVASFALVCSLVEPGLIRYAITQAGRALKREPDEVEEIDGADRVSTVA